MYQQIQQIDENIFTISDIFTRNECSQLIQRAESIGFEAASVRTANGPQMITQIRNNDRVVLSDTKLAADMWHRIVSFLPVIDGGHACGVDSQIRFYRYLPGQQFKRHKDGFVTNKLGQTSKLSYLVYLNNDCEGGSTIFRDYRHINGTREKIQHIVSPTAGTALLFRHEQWHEGSPVTAGVK